ncbi:MAG: Flp pilus assembly protein CpaB [Alphaproteobacteria bacterium]|nr:Flp pilus assembly protein CpaB [Alphaproteobacteria bacterium]
MRSRALITALLGVVVAGSAVSYVQMFMKSPIGQMPMRDVVIVVETIPFGGVIDPEMLAVQAWPAHAVPNGSFSTLPQVASHGNAEPRRAKFALAKGDVLLESKVSDFGEPVSITQQIDPSMRAVTIGVNDSSGVAGLIAPADRIDLTLTRSIDNNLVTSTILQGVEVLGIDRPGAGRKSGPGKVKTVTVQVEPEDAQKLALAQQAGTLSLSLRHIDAADRPSLATISVEDLTERAKPAPVKKRVSLPTIVVNRGGERSTVEVPSG